MALTAPIACRRAQKEVRAKYYVREGAISHTKGESDTTVGTAESRF